jgi:hypothetical protein
MKTAMQELIEHLNHVKEFNTMIPGIIKGAENLLEKEKEQIMDAYWQGAEDIVNVDMTLGEQSEEYYNEFYNQNK